MTRQSIGRPQQRLPHDERLFFEMYTLNGRSGIRIVKDKVVLIDHSCLAETCDVLRSLAKFDRLSRRFTPFRTSTNASGEWFFI